jgi:hypothetical protein
MDCAFPRPVEPVRGSPDADPHGPFAINGDAGDVVLEEAETAASIKGPEGEPVEAGQPSVGADPEEALCILDSHADAVPCETLHRRVGGQGQALRCGVRRAGGEERKYEHAQAAAARARRFAPK